MRHGSERFTARYALFSRRPFTGLGFALVCAVFCLGARAQSLADIMHNDHGHDSEEWVSVAQHLPDPATASKERLELAADVLRARRFYADSLAFYNAALNHGADQHLVLKKMGIACLELQQPAIAKMLFARAVRLDKHDAVAWNDLAAADLALGNAHGAVGEYRHAVKVNRDIAVFHANLALAYFEVRSPDEARRELERAVHLDPEVLHRTAGGGFSAQVLSSEHYGDICLQMAHLYAQNGNQAVLLEWLGKASERGLNLRAAMEHDPVLHPWLSDPRVLVLLQNHQRLNASTKAPAGVASLGAAPLPQ